MKNWMFIKRLFFDIVSGIISATIQKQKNPNPFPLSPVIKNDKAHCVGWIIWIGQIVEILGIIAHKQTCLDHDPQQQVGMKFVSYYGH